MHKHTKYILFFTTLFAFMVLFFKKTDSPSTSTTSEAVSAHAIPDTSPSAIINKVSTSSSGPTAKIQTPPRKKTFDKPFQYFKDRLEVLDSCFEQPCKFSNKDAKSYEYAVYSEIENTLDTLKTWQNRHDFKDPRISQLMTKFLAYEKSEIKVKALEILSTQLKDERVVPHVLEHVISQAYPTPIGSGLKELARYKNGKFKNQIDDTIVDVLTHGSIYSAVEVAKNLKPLMDSQNKQKFSRALDQLSDQPLSRDIYVALKTSLDH